MRFFLFSFFLLQGLCLSAQVKNRIEIRFIPTFNGKPLVLDDVYSLPGGDSISLECLRFYVSNMAFYNNDELQNKRGAPVLFDAASENPMVVFMEKPSVYNMFRFSVGIDSVTNTSGALGGDLDPTKGMYWTWQSGYINLKLEGRSGLCPTRHHRFEFHLGGYNGVQNALQTIVFPIENGSPIQIEISLDMFFSQINLAKQNMVMIPGKEAVMLSRLFAQTFSLMP